jgi:hypothetical protein
MSLYLIYLHILVTTIRLLILDLLSLDVLSINLLLKLPAFYSENIIFLYYKASYLNEEVNGTEPYP